MYDSKMYLKLFFILFFLNLITGALVKKEFSWNSENKDDKPGLFSRLGQWGKRKLSNWVDNKLDKGVNLKTKKTGGFSSSFSSGSGSSWNSGGSKSFNFGSNSAVDSEGNRVTNVWSNNDKNPPMEDLKFEEVKFSDISSDWDKFEPFTFDDI
ncbi:hypothetical protein SNEBB_008622 [Seison nebaliae]|nr:hypothetical protein SNEBB_008622 [Seison nebaliae]